MNQARVSTLLTLLACLAAALPASAQQPSQFGTRLRGFGEVPPLATPGGGRFTATINEEGTEVSYRLEYRNLEGSVLQAHIHFAQPGVNGGIMVFLCTNLDNPPSDVPACPFREGVVTGTLRASDVIGPTGQGVAPGEMVSLIRALRNGTAYANVHSTSFPGGEIRGDIRALGTGSAADQE